MLPDAPAGPEIEPPAERPGVNTRTSINPRYWHYWISLLLATALVPIAQRLHLPLNFEWQRLAIAYWIVLAAQSIFVAVLLSVIAWPASLTIYPLWQRCRRQPMRILLALLFCAVLFWAFGWIKALVLTLDAIALLELYERNGRFGLRRDLVAVVLPGAYFFAGFLLVLAYNVIIVSVRYPFAYDPVFNAADQWILHGATVSTLSHWALQALPLRFFHFLEFIYFGMFWQIGAAIILVSLFYGRACGMQFIGTILLAYYLALAAFYLWPSQGPYYLCPAHFSRFPSTLQAYNIEKFLMSDAQGLWNHVPIHRISTDYFIAFPCMHIAQPLIVLWFLRRWKRMFIALCAYDLLLIASILLLEFHYFVDILGGLLVAAIAIFVTARPTTKKARLPVAAHLTHNYRSTVS
jgi:hypothetical protein